MSLNQTKKEKLTTLLYQSFLSSEELSINDIMKILNSSRRTAYYYIEQLRKKGITIDSKTKHGKSYYFIKQKDTDYLKYKEINKNILRKYVIVQMLQKEPLTKAELRKRFSLSSSHTKNTEETYSLDIGKTKFYQLIDELIESNELTYDKNKRLLPTGNQIPFHLSLSEKDFWQTYSSLELLSPGHPYYSQLISVYQKQSILIGDLDFEKNQTIWKDYFIYGKKYPEFSQLQILLKKLKPYPYQEKALIYTYKTQTNDTVSVMLATGLLVYSLEKDKLYIIGNTLLTGEDIIINISSILSIETTEFSNRHFQSSYYLQLYEDMFSISIEKPVRVVIEFDYISNIPLKLQQLASQRKKAKIAIKENKLIYTDKISGLSDFANYLRRFGNNFQVIEPLKLRERMEFSAKRALNRYKEENFDNE